MPPAPWGGASGHAHTNGAGPAPSPPPAWSNAPQQQQRAPAGYAPAGAVMPGAPQPFPVGGQPAAIRPRPRSEGGFDFKWFLGWLAIAVVIAGIILLIVWSSVTAYDRFNQERGAAAVSATQVAAKKAFDEGRFEEALAGYLAATKGLSGPQLAVVRRNASGAALNVARIRFKARNAVEAEQFALQAIELNPDSGLAYTELGRARALAGNVDAAVKAYDDGAAATDRVRTSSTADQQAKAEATEAANNLPLWKAEALYNDGRNQLTKNQMLAKQRFEAVIQVAPRSQFARNAEIELQKLELLGGDDLGGGQPLRDPPDAGKAPDQPDGWDTRYRQALPNTPSAAPPSGGYGPLGLPR